MMQRTVQCEQLMLRTAFFVLFISEKNDSKLTVLCLCVCVLARVPPYQLLNQLTYTHKFIIKRFPIGSHQALAALTSNKCKLHLDFSLTAITIRPLDL